MASIDDQELYVPDVNLGQFMIDNMKKYGSAVALVGVSFFYQNYSNGTITQNMILLYSYNIE